LDFGLIGRRLWPQAVLRGLAPPVTAPRSRPASPPTPQASCRPNDRSRQRRTGTPHPNRNSSFSKAARRPDRPLAGWAPGKQSFMATRTRPLAAVRPTPAVRAEPVEALSSVRAELVEAFSEPSRVAEGGTRCGHQVGPSARGVDCFNSRRSPRALSPLLARCVEGERWCATRLRQAQPERQGWDERPLRVGSASARLMTAVTRRPPRPAESRGGPVTDAEHSQVGPNRVRLLSTKAAANPPRPSGWSQPQAVLLAAQATPSWGPPTLSAHPQHGFRPCAFRFPLSPPTAVASLDRPSCGVNSSCSGCPGKDHAVRLCPYG
jgi:hypothetical protein